jgi:uncharacterized protein (TIRG00374 family)
MKNTAGSHDYRWMRWLPGVLISILAMYVIYRTIKWEELISAFSNLDPFLILSAILLFLISLVFRSMEYCQLTGNRVPIVQSFLGLNIGYFFNNILPLRLGELVRPIYLGQTANISAFYAFSSVVVERIFDIGIAAILLLVSLPHVIEGDWASVTAYIAISIVVFLFICIYLVARNKDAVLAFIKKKTARSNFFQKQVLPSLNSLFDGFSVISNWRVFIPAFAFLCISWGISLIEYFFVMRNFIPETQLWWAIFSLGVVALGVAIPSAPANIGVFEAALVGALMVFKINASSALAFAICIHFYHFIINDLIGIYALFRGGHSMSYWLTQVQLKRKV